MSFKALITHVVADRDCPLRLRMTVEVAKLLQAEVWGLGAVAPWPYSTGSGAAADFEQVVASVKNDLASANARFHEAVGDAGVSSVWRERLGYPDQVLPGCAAAADLVVAYRPEGQFDPTVYARPDALIMECGLPVLLLPRRQTEFRTERLLVAWKNTREARRAIALTLPLLKLAGHVLVAAVCKDGEAAAVEAELGDVAQRLARHGVAAATLVEVGAPGAAGRRLARIAETDRSGVIVAGAYGHSRFREWALGGVTRDLIADGSRYVLLSH